MPRPPAPLVPLCLLLVALVAPAAETVAETPRVSASGFIRHWPGELPIVLSVPHDGAAKPADIPDRTSGVTVRDSYATALGHALRDALYARFGQAPQLVVCELSRKKVDCNREIAEGAAGQPVEVVRLGRGPIEAVLRFSTHLEAESAALQAENAALQAAMEALKEATADAALRAEAAEAEARRAKAAAISANRSPSAATRCGASRCSSTSSTASATRADTGLPPNVLKWMRVVMAFAMAGVVTTAASGQPLPMPLAIVTMSGITPCVSNPQKCVPVLPKPVCTSSAMHTPPAARMCS